MSVDIFFVGKPDARLNDDLWKLLKRLPDSSKRNLLQELGSKGGSVQLPSRRSRPAPGNRTASSPAFAAISENDPQEDNDRVRERSRGGG